MEVDNVSESGGDVSLSDNEWEELIRQHEASIIEAEIESSNEGKVRVSKSKANQGHATTKGGGA